MKSFFLSLIFCIVSFSVVLAQDTMRTRYGFEGSLMFIKHQTDFRSLPGVENCCPDFTKAEASGFTANLVYERPIDEHFFYGARFGYMKHDGRLELQTNTDVFVDSTTKKSGAYTNSLNIIASSIGLEPRIGVRLFDLFTVSLGLRAGMLLRANYSKFEKTLAGNFLDDNGNNSLSNIRKQSSGDLTNTPLFLFHGIATAGIEIPADREKTFYLVPEVGYALALNDLVDGVGWKINALKFGLTFKFSPKPKGAPPIIDYDDETVPVAISGDSVVPQGLPYSFTKAPFINPKIVKDLTTLVNDVGDQVTTINLTESQESNRYIGTFANKMFGGKYPFVFYNEQPTTTEFGYQYIGVTKSGIYVLRTTDTQNMTTINKLLFVKIKRDVGLKYDQQTQTMTRNPRVLLMKVGEMRLYGEWDGRLEIKEDKIFIGNNSNGKSHWVNIEY